MNYLETVQDLFKEKREFSGHLSRFRADSVETQNFSGMTVFIEGDGLVFAQLRKKLALNETTHIDVIEGRYITFKTRDEDGPLHIHLDIY